MTIRCMLVAIAHVRMEASAHNSIFAFRSNVRSPRDQASESIFPAIRRLLLITHTSKLLVPPFHLLLPILTTSTRAY